MSSTELRVGLTNSSRPSSRVLKPPGGGHSNIFAEPEVSVNAPRPKYNQQNSSNLNACIGSTDPNQVVEKLREELQQQPAKTETKQATSDNKSNGSATNNKNNDNGNSGASQKSRIPPGGHSSGGFW